MARLQERVYSTLRERVYQVQLPNGFNLMVIPKEGFKETCAMIKVNYGGVDIAFTVDGQEVRHPLGLAHFLEHQVFVDSDNGDFTNRFTSIGSDSNAFTGLTSTNYYFSGLDAVEEGLRFLQDLVGKDRFTALSMVKEKSIIKQEIDMYLDDPDYRLYSSCLAGLFPETPLATDLAGTHQDIDQITYEDLKSAYDVFYRPQNMTMLVVGDVDPEEVYNLVKSCQDSYQQPESQRVEGKAIAYNEVLKKQTFAMDVSQPKLGLAFRQPPLKTGWFRQRLALKLYLNLLIGWTSSNYQNWYDQGRVDDSFDLHVEVNDQFQFVVLVLDTAEPIAMSAKLKQVLRSTKPHPDANQDHFMTLKKELYGEFLTTLDRLDDLLSLYLEHDQAGESYFDCPTLLDSLTLDDVLAIGREFFGTAASADVTIFPK